MSVLLVGQVGLRCACSAAAAWAPVRKWARRTLAAEADTAWIRLRFEQGRGGQSWDALPASHLVAVPPWTPWTRQPGPQVGDRLNDDDQRIDHVLRRIAWAGLLRSALADLHKHLPCLAVRRRLPPESGLRRA